MHHRAHAGHGRRRFLAFAAAGAGLALPVGRAARASAEPWRALSFHNIHTKESLAIVYWAEGRYLPGPLAAIDHHLRDFRTGEVRAIDPALLDLLHRLNQTLGNDDTPLHVVSGYRSPETNAMLARRSSQVSTTSYHMYGRAIDIRLPGCGLSTLRDTARRIEGGGVGYYPESAFVHLDTGPVRSW